MGRGDAVAAVGCADASAWRHPPRDTRPGELWDHIGMNASADRPRAKSLSPLRSLLPFLRPYRGMAYAAIGALLIATGAMLALPFALRRVIDVLAVKDASTTNRMFILFLAAAVVWAGAAAIRFYLVTWVGERVIADLRTAVYRRVVHMDPLVLRDHPGRRSAVAADDGHDARAGHLRRQPLHHPAIELERRRLADIARVHQRPAHRHHSGAGTGSRRAAHPHRSPGTRFVTGLAGPHRGHERPCGRDLECHSNGAGIHAGGSTERALSQCRRGELCGGGAAYAGKSACSRRSASCSCSRPSSPSFGWVRIKCWPAR